MAVRVDALDPGSDRDVGDAAALLTAYWREVLGPDEPATSTREIRRSLRLDRDDIDRPVLLARDGATTLGFARPEIRVGHGNEHMLSLEDLYVFEQHRRRGAGRALLDEVIRLARERGRTLIAAGYHEGSIGGAAFCDAVGARLANRERQNRVRVADLDRPMLETWVAAAAVGAPGYSLVGYDDVCPDELLPEVLRVKEAMNDAPRSEAIGDFVTTAESFRASELERHREDQHLWYVAARHDESGQLAGYSQLFFSPDKPWLVEQGDTAVDPAHRGHGIGRWVKAANALRLLDERPDAQVIETWNDGSNRWMLAINDDMGFCPVATWIEAELDL